MTDTIRVARGTVWPIDAVTETFWWLGKRGSGKTHNCSVFVEELLGVGAQVVVIDPMSAWWGLRSSTDGRSAGFPIAIFGGPHGDLPLEPTAGAYMADLAVAERVSMILDVKQWTRADRRRFVTAFLERLLSRNQDAMHVVLEEAPLFAPQRPQKGDETMLGVVEEVVKLGRGSGIGVSLISQRSATLNKEVSTQTEVIVAHRSPAPQDREAVKAWFDVHASDQVKAAMERLPHLPTGTALVSSTDFLGFFGEVQFRPRRTFDSSATPKAGETRLEAKTLADVDLAAIKEQMSESIERAKLDDPKELRRRIVELERQLAHPVIQQVPVEVLVPTVPVDIYKMAKHLLEDFDDAVLTMGSWREGFAADLELIETAMEGVGVEVPNVMPLALRPGTPERYGETLVATRARAEISRGALTEDLGLSDAGALPAGERKILTAVAQYPEGAGRDQITILTGFKKSTRDTYIQRLRQKDYVSGGTVIFPTEAGILALGPDFEPLPTGAALRAYWLDRLPEGERRILAELISVWPDSMPRDMLTERAGYMKSTRDTYLQRLRARRLVGEGEPKASDTLFDGRTR